MNRFTAVAIVPGLAVAALASPAAAQTREDGVYVATFPRRAAPGTVTAVNGSSATVVLPRRRLPRPATRQLASIDDENAQYEYAVTHRMRRCPTNGVVLLVGGAAARTYRCSPSGAAAPRSVGPAFW